MMDAKKVYDLFRRAPDEGRSSHLHDHYRRGLKGIMRPPASKTAARAAWDAGRDTAAKKEPAP